jgi:hypothetical protein
MITAGMGNGRHSVTRRQAHVERLATEVEELNRLCWALPECDATGKLRGKLGRLHDSLAEYKADGDLKTFRRDVEAAEELVVRIHADDPLALLLIRLSELRRLTTDMDVHHA